MARTDEQHAAALRERLNAAHEKVEELLLRAQKAGAELQNHADEARQKAAHASSVLAELQNHADEARQKAAHASSVLADLQRVAADIKALRSAL